MELLIVIVVIGILAAISLVAYAGVQAKARDTIRTDDAAKIIRALEAHKVAKGTYPLTNAGPTPPCQAGYACSLATDGSWLKGLVDEGFMNNPPKSPNNTATSYYRYYRAAPGQYGCDVAIGGFYVLEVHGYERTANVPRSTYSADKRCAATPWQSYAGAAYATYYGYEN